ncbi:MAG: NAD(P)/FAD-dependent oxidoreductase [Myxococcales bacterium]|nr:NAD(P)/FAD-dependent oxidoreductase [Myxococcales bacterium]
MSRFDLCILGAGPAGYAAAMRAHDLGKTVALVEAKHVGGTGLHSGALSSKTMWHLAMDYSRARKVGRGFKAGKIEVSYASVMESVKEAVSERRELLCLQLEHLGKSGIELIHGRGKFLSPSEVEVACETGTRTVVADHFLIATGSKPRVPGGIVIDGERIITSDHVESWEDFPRSLVIVGSGVVGCEYATIFGHYDRTNLFMIDRRDRILPFEDEDVSQSVASAFEKMGVTIHRRAQMSSLVATDDGVEYEVECDGSLEKFSAERALISIGRVPNFEGLALEAAGVGRDEHGGIRVRETRTDVEHIFAAGDATADMALANVAELEGQFAVESMFGIAPRPIDYRSLPTIMFLSPEVASVGLGEQQARERGVAHRVASIANHLICRNVAMRNTDGFIKLLAAPDNTVLGLRVVGPQASSCIQGMALLIELGGKLEDIARCAHPHPAVTEGVQECARLLLGRSILKPEFVEGVRVENYEPPTDA